MLIVYQGNLRHTLAIYQGLESPLTFLFPPDNQRQPPPLPPFLPRVSHHDNHPPLPPDNQLSPQVSLAASRHPSQPLSRPDNQHSLPLTPHPSLRPKPTRSRQDSQLIPVTQLPPSSPPSHPLSQPIQPVHRDLHPSSHPLSQDQEDAAPPHNQHFRTLSQTDSHPSTQPQVYLSRFLGFPLEWLELEAR